MTDFYKSKYMETLLNLKNEFQIYQTYLIDGADPIRVELLNQQILNAYQNNK